MTSPGHPAVERVSAYLAADLSERDAAGVRRHLAACAACSRVAEELGRQTEALGALDRPEPPVTMWAAIEGACEVRAPRGLGWADALGPWRLMASGALGLGVGALAVAGLFLWGPLASRRGRGDVAVSSPRAAPRGNQMDGERREEALRAEEVVRRPGPGPDRGAGEAAADPLLAEAESELGRAALAYQTAASRLRAILDHAQLDWDPAQRARVAERLARLDEAVADSQALVRRDPGDGARAEMLFAAYQKQIDFMAEAVHRGGSSLAMPLGEPSHDVFWRVR
jgi:hypothetical protein